MFLVFRERERERNALNQLSFQSNF